MNKNLCIRRAIKWNRFGAERDSRMGPNPSASRDPDKARIVVWVPGTAAQPAKDPLARIRRLERDRRRIVAAKFIPLTHPYEQTRVCRRALSFCRHRHCRRRPFPIRAVKSALRYYAARGSPRHPVYTPAAPSSFCILTRLAPDMPSFNVSFHFPPFFL